MTDEFDIEYVNHSDAQDIIDWAIRTGAMVMIMDSLLPTTTIKEAVGRLEDWEEIVGIMFDSMPEVMRNASTSVAQQSYEEAVLEEEQVEQFLNEIKDL